MNYALWTTSCRVCRHDVPESSPGSTLKHSNAPQTVCVGVLSPVFVDDCDVEFLQAQALLAKMPRGVIQICEPTQRIVVFLFVRQTTAGIGDYLFETALVLDKDGTQAYITCVCVHRCFGVSIEVRERGLALLQLL